MSVKFDRYLEGLCYDPHRDLDSLSFTLAIDDKTDLYKNISYTIEELPDKSLLYHWYCDIPKEFKDSKSHKIYGKIARENANAVEMQGDWVLNPLVPPQIGFAAYPWRDLSLPAEKQVPDPLRILVSLMGTIRPEWVKPLEQPGAWHIVGVGSPASVDIDPGTGAAILHLKDPLKESTTVELGPMSLEEDMTRRRPSYDLYVDNGKKDILLSQPCYCDLAIDGQASHDYLQTENFAWAYKLSTDPLPCGFPIPTEGYQGFVFRNSYPLYES